MRHAIGYAIDRQAIVDYLRRGLATPSRRACSRPPTGRSSRTSSTSTYDPDARRRLLDEAGYPDPDGDGPRPRLTLSFKTSNVEFNRLQAAVIQQNLQRRRHRRSTSASYEFATLYADILKGNFQMYSLQWVGGAARRPRHSAPRLSLASRCRRPVSIAAISAIPEVDRLIDEAHSATDLEDAPRALRQGPAALAELAPYISLWHETNFALASPSSKASVCRRRATSRFLRNVSR